ncbi:MAG: AMP-binding protein [Deltaproteobacteria bacterium]|nr:AMP-binding protein [Deltaproteobacteria bacterium]MBW2444348.1 AMP-binding protein [Deltaproteobacteria bacterium]
MTETHPPGPRGSSPPDSPRFPAFSEAYRRHWVGAGNWAGRTLHDVFDAFVETRPDDLAIVTKDRRYTFREFKENSDALAAGLLGVGVGREDLVSVQLPNWPEFCFLQIALSRIGAVIQPLHLVFREREIRSLLEFCETDVAIVPESFGDYGYADTVREIRDELPRLRLMVVARGSAKGPGECALDALIEEGRENLDRLDGLENDPNAIFYLNFTSGTEGNPKGFLHTHNTLISTFKMAAEAMSKMNPGMVNLACSPMTHSFGHFTTYQCAMGGIPMVLVDRYRPVDVLELIQREKVTSISGTPAHMIGILHHPDFSKYDTSSVTSVGVGGARSAPGLIDELEQVWGCKSANTYGMGETILHTRTMPFDPPDKIRDTVGKPMFGAQLKIVDQNDRTRELPAGEVGEIVFRGPTLFVGYHKQPELTAETRDDEGWFYTGDLGFADEDGYLCFAGRAKEVINRGGSKIYPKEIEDLLSGHPKILDVAVVGAPDDRLGERVCAYIVTEGGDELGLEGVREFLDAQKTTKYMYPERIIRLDEMPMTPTGKIRKATLQQDIAERVKSEEAS